MTTLASVQHETTQSHATPYRVHKVHADYTMRTRRRRGNLGDGDGRGVAREDGTLRGDFTECVEELTFERRVFLYGRRKVRSGVGIRYEHVHH